MNYGLTAAEQAALAELTNDRTNTQIAELLNKDVRTVEKQVSSALKKLGYKNRYAYFASGSLDVGQQTTRSKEEEFDSLPIGAEPNLPSYSSKTPLTRSLEGAGLLGQSQHRLPPGLKAAVQEAVAEGFAAWFGDDSVNKGSRLGYRRIAIYGLGQTAKAIAEVASQLRIEVVIYDSRPRTEELSQQALQLSLELKVPVILNWSGDFRETACDLIVPSPTIYPKNSALSHATRNGILIASEADFAFQIASAPILAVSGTIGKNTTALLTWHFLRAAGVDAKLSTRFLHHPENVWPLVKAAAVTKPHQVLVASLGYWQFEWVPHFHPKVAAITNIEVDNLDRYGTQGEHERIVRRVFAKMGREDFVVSNDSDPKTLPNRTRGPVVLAYGGTDSVDKHSVFESDHEIKVFDQRVIKSDLPLQEPWMYNYAMCAALLAIAGGAPREGSWLVAGLKTMAETPSTFLK